jgi:hypothetical protein
MSQNDYTIANQSAPDFRSDLNDALQALASLSSGSTAPSTTYAYMFWYDTANDILKMRTGADDGWINVMDFDQGNDTAVPSLVDVDNTNALSSNSATVPPSTRATRVFVEDKISNLIYESSEQTITSNTFIVVAHGFGSVPREMWAVLRCKSPELGYAIGDEAGFLINDRAGNDASAALSTDSTNIYLPTGDSAFKVVDRIASPTADFTTITSSSWRVVIRARK